MDRVLQVAAVEFPPDSRIERTIETLSESGYEVGMLCLKNKRNNIKKWGSCRIYRLPFGESSLPSPLNWVVDYSLFTIIGTIYVYYLSLFKGYNIIHYNNPPDFMVPLLIPLKMVGKKIVYDAHEVTHLLLESRVKGALRRITSSMMKFWQTLAIISADVVITVSDLAKKELEKMYNKRRVYVVENTIKEIPKYDKLKRTNSKTIVFAYIGSFISDRDIDTIIEAFSGLNTNNAKLWLIGGKVETKDKRIKSFGKVPHKEALNLYTKSDVALITLRDTPINSIGNPNRLYEAMAFGKAIICADLPGPRSILRDTGVYYEPGNKRSLMKAMKRFIDNPGLIREYGEKAQSLFYKEYTWDKIGKKLVDAYKQLG